MLQIDIAPGIVGAYCFLAATAAQEGQPSLRPSAKHTLISYLELH